MAESILPDKRRHRGPHPEDAELFASAALPSLRRATADLCWLLSRGYASPSALKLVGDRYDLTQRQRTAVLRCACSDRALEQRRQRECRLDALRGGTLEIDGYNVLTTVEAALAGGVVLVGRDGSYRDMASMHGTYRHVQETLPALELVGRTLTAAGVEHCRWYLDRPVSNSGRLKKHIEAVAAKNQWPWQVEIVNDPDRVLIDSRHIVATADSIILDAKIRWYALGRETVNAHVPQAWFVDLSGVGDGEAA